MNNLIIFAVLFFAVLFFALRAKSQNKKKSIYAVIQFTAFDESFNSKILCQDQYRIKLDEPLDLRLDKHQKKAKIQAERNLRYKELLRKYTVGNPQ